MHSHSQTIPLCVLNDSGAMCNVKKYNTEFGLHSMAGDTQGIYSSFPYNSIKDPPSLELLGGILRRLI